VARLIVAALIVLGLIVAASTVAWLIVKAYARCREFRPAILPV
jgi:hypothetical protein